VSAVETHREPVIRVRGLRKAYGTHEALRGIDLDVHPGEVVAILGPNGAGKTTMLEILEGYRARDGGDVAVLGGDPVRHDPTRLARIGICLQATGIERYLTAVEVLTLYGGYYPRPRSAEELLAVVGLADQARTRVRRLSGGQRRRLDLALALVGDPELLFLDEPTTGFDPEARRQAWDLVRALVGSGRTVLLTTHFMDEAHALADRIAVLVDGAIVAQGTVDEVVGDRARESLIRFRPSDASTELPAPLEDSARRRPGGIVEIPSSQPTVTLHELTSWAIGTGVELRDLAMAPPSLEDAYLALVAERTEPGS
jgi:ABC-2 type transport system ATP-binding protein